MVDLVDAETMQAVCHTFFTFALDAMMLTVPDSGGILDANPAACTMFGLTVEQIRAGGREALRDPADERWAAGVAERGRTGRFAGELSFRRADGSTFAAEVSSSVFRVGPRQYAVLILRDATERHRLEAQLREALALQSRLAMTDELTGLLNRRGFLTASRQQFEQAARDHDPLFLVLADADGLKQVNDEHGHEAGDRMLSEIAAVLIATFRGADVVARVGGDEFAVILAGAHAAGAAATAADRLRSNLARRGSEQRLPYPLSVSIGIARAEPGEPAKLDDLLRSADRELYEAKAARPG